MQKIITWSNYESSLVDALKDIAKNHKIDIIVPLECMGSMATQRIAKAVIVCTETNESINKSKGRF